MEKILIFLISIFSIKCDFWLEKVNGHSKNKGEFSGIAEYKQSDFYLCSERKYKVHYVGEDNETWSKDFTACEPVGNGNYFDAISISGDQKYAAKADKIWGKEIIGYIDDNSNAYAGEINKDFQGIYIYGDEIYRSSVMPSFSTNENLVANRFVKYLFSKKYEDREKLEEIYKFEYNK